MIDVCKTKIIATLGPSSSSYETIKTLIKEGVRVFRLNFSHGTHEDHHARIQCIRKAEIELAQTVAILGDLQGPKLRVGTFVNKRETLELGQKFTLNLDKIKGTHESVTLPHPEIFEACAVGDNILINDGRIVLNVSHISQREIKTNVIRGGEISNHKGVNIPGASLKISPITAKDKKDLAFALDEELDWIALSFVQCADDVHAAKKIINNRARVLSKIEKPQALQDLEQIISASDAIMVARGDLGVELALEEVPPAQHRIIRMCREMQTPVVVATQMLESMIDNEIPTRAEVTDVAEAVYAGVDGVMLSAESASGKFPIESVRMMRKVVSKVESDPHYIARLHEATHQIPLSDGRGTFIRAATVITEGISTKAIICFSTTGATAISSAISRPHVPVVCLTPHLKTARYVNLIWGLEGYVAQNVMSIREMVEEACTQVVKNKCAQNGDTILITGGFPFGSSGPPNVLRLVEVGKSETYG